MKIESRVKIVGRLDKVEAEIRKNSNSLESRSHRAVQTQVVDVPGENTGMGCNSSNELM